MVVQETPVQTSDNGDKEPVVASPQRAHPRDSLLDRVDALGDALSQALAPLEKREYDLDARLRERVRVRIRFLIHQEQAALAALKPTVGSSGDPTAGSLATAWRRYESIEAACRPLFRECLALTEGTASRRGEPRLDRGLCDIADALLDDLSYQTDVPWGRFTILATGEAYGEMADIIRLRFPQISIWDLPVAAHEFGHFLALRIQRRGLGRGGSPLEERLQKLRVHPQRQRFLHEHFADAFATVALGPAFVFTALNLRLDPTAKADDGRTRDPTARHPTDHRRASVILGVLAAMDGAYGPLVADVRDGWQSSRRVCGRRDGLGQRERAQLDSLAADLLSIIHETLPRDVRFGWDEWGATDVIASNLAAGRDPESGPSLQRLINAGWRARNRMSDRYALGDLERRLWKACYDLAQRRLVGEGRR